VGRHVGYPVSGDRLINGVWFPSLDPPSVQLEKAILHTNREEVERLLKNGVRVNDPQMRSELHLALSINDESFIDFLIDQNVNVNQKDAVGWTPLHLAARESSMHTIIKLILAGAQLTATTASGTLALHYFTSRKFSKSPSNDIAALWILCQLLTYGDVNARNDSQETPLHYACQGQADYHIIRFLLSHGADPSLKTEKGCTAKMLMSQRSQDEICKKSLYFLELESFEQCFCGPTPSAPYHVQETKKAAAQIIAGLLRKSNYLVMRSLLSMKVSDASNLSLKWMLLFINKPFDLYTILLREEFAEVKELALLLRGQGVVEKYLQLLLSFAGSEQLIKPLKALSQFSNVRPLSHIILQRTKSTSNQQQSSSVAITTTAPNVDYLKKFIRQILRTPLPPLICKLCHCTATFLISKSKSERNSSLPNKNDTFSKKKLKRWAVSSVAFLRYMSPIISSSDKVRRLCKFKTTPPKEQLIYASKIFIKLANNDKFSGGEHVDELNEIINDCRDLVDDYIDATWMHGKETLSVDVIPKPDAVLPIEIEGLRATLSSDYSLFSEQYAKRYMKESKEDSFFDSPEDPKIVFDQLVDAVSRYSTAVTILNIAAQMPTPASAFPPKRKSSITSLLPRRSSQKPF